MTEEKSKIYQLLSFVLNGSNHVLPGEKFASDLVQDCMDMFNRDFICTVVDNGKGNLCSTYPVKLVIPIKQKSLGHRKLLTGYELEEMNELIQRAKLARTRGRFPTPVLLVGNKFICRSSTLARSPEIYTRAGYQYFLQSDQTVVDSDNNLQTPDSNEKNASDSGECDKNDVNQPNISVQYKVNGSPLSKSTRPSLQYNGNTPKRKVPTQNTQCNGANGSNTQWMIDKMRNNDIDLLSFLKTNVICDFMVENKKVKFGMNVTSSEKVDRQQRYSQFDLISIPYPGCEFFADYTNNNYTGVGLKFDWSQQFVDAQLQVPDKMSNASGVDWKDYIHWDLVKLTQNYLKLLLNCICKPDCTGILLHCISGWDRTPLFVSLLRLSLWADGLIHQSLNAEEMVYLTLAYDWLLFSHQFANRIEKSEEIMRFCFDFLEHIVSSEYSLLNDKRHIDVFYQADNKETEDMFYLEPSEVESNGCMFESNGINGHSLHTSQIDQNSKNNDAEHEHNFYLDDVKQCVESMVNNVEGHQFNGQSPQHGVVQETEEKNNGSNHELNCLKKCDSAAIIPLTDDNLPAEDIQICLNGNWTESIKTTLSHQQLPSSVLSASYETAKLNMALQKKIDDPKQLSSSCHNVPSKSTPIKIPFVMKEIKKSSSTVCLNECKTCQSVNGTSAEPGSSWQMIASPPENNFSLRENGSFTSDAISINTSQSSRKSSFTISSNGFTETDTFKQKMIKRKEKLILARNIMIPAYCDAVQMQRKKQEQQSGPLSTFMGHLANFVKGS